MSIANCDRCGTQVDTDVDLYCYRPINTRDWECICYSCRNHDDLALDALADDPRHVPYSNLRSK